MLDKKGSLLDNLGHVEKGYLKLMVLKQLEGEAYEKSDYESLHELSENERTIIEEIIGIMKYIVPDLLYFRKDSKVRDKMRSLENLHTSIIKKSLKLRQDLSETIIDTRKRIENLRLFPKSFSSSHPQIVNLRA